jgi:hypothetical protein
MIRRVEISNGTIIRAYVEGQTGRRPLPGDLGKQLFLVDVVRGEDRETYWQGLDYGEAIRASEEARANHGITAAVADRVTGDRTNG